MICKGCKDEFAYINVDAPAMNIYINDHSASNGYGLQGPLQSPLPPKIPVVISVFLG